MMGKVKLRPYQLDSVEGLRALLRAGKRNIICSVPTGGGKTVIGSHLIEECFAKPGRRAVFVADRIALIEQTSATFDRYGIPHGVIQGGCNVKHCEEMQRQFAAAGVVTDMYTYRTGDEARTALVEEFRKPDSTVRGLISVSALSKGFDVSDVEVIIMARPLKSSLAEHIQILGRGLRIHPGKTECIVLDHSGNCVRFWGAMHYFLEKGVTELDDGTKAKRAPAMEFEKKPTKCPNCACVHDPLPACPSCGHVYKQSQIIEHTAGALREVSAATKPAELTAQEKREFHAQLAYIAAEKGRKPGWVSHKYKEKFGAWPADRDVLPMQPSTAVLKWVKSREIAFAKGKRS